MSHCDYDALNERRFEAIESYTILTPSNVMDILGIGKNSVYSLLNSGQLKGFRIGRSWRVSAESLEDFMLMHK